VNLIKAILKINAFQEMAIDMESSFESLSFYRGTSAKYPEKIPSVIKPRNDRRPKNSSIRFHEIADTWFEKNFGIRYRSQGVFLTSSKLTAAAYAETPSHVMRVVPISEYRFCWSPSVSDLLFGAKRLENAESNEIQSYLDSMNYREYDLKDAHEKSCEVMLYCKEYVCIPIGLLEEDMPDNKGAIISL
jgi:hypothetical protein